MRKKRRAPKFRNQKQEYDALRRQIRKIKSRPGRQNHLRGLGALMKFDKLLKRARGQ